MNVFAVAIEKPKTTNFTLGVVDGCSPNRIAGEPDVRADLRFLREIGYKLE
jgi:adenosine/AMP kinase